MPSIEKMAYYHAKLPYIASTLSVNFGVSQSHKKDISKLRVIIKLRLYIKIGMYT